MTKTAEDHEEPRPNALQQALQIAGQRWNETEPQPQEDIAANPTGLVVFLWTPEMEARAEEAKERQWQKIQKRIAKDQATDHDPTTCLDCISDRADRIVAQYQPKKVEENLRREREEEAKHQLQRMNHRVTQMGAEVSRSLRKLKNENKVLRREVEELKTEMAKRGPGWRTIRTGWREWFGAWLKSTKEA